MDYEVRRMFVSSRIPQNMYPDRDVEQSQARTAALSRSWDSKEGMLYVDGGGSESGIATMAVADAKGRVVRITSIRARSVAQEEEAPIALVIVCSSRATIISDTQKAMQELRSLYTGSTPDKNLSEG